MITRSESSGVEFYFDANAVSEMINGFPTIKKAIENIEYKLEAIKETELKNALADGKINHQEAMDELIACTKNAQGASLHPNPWNPLNWIVTSAHASEGCKITLIGGETIVVHDTKSCLQILGRGFLQVLWSGEAKFALAQGIADGLVEQGQAIAAIAEDPRAFMSAMTDAVLSMINDPAKFGTDVVNQTLTDYANFLKAVESGDFREAGKVYTDLAINLLTKVAGPVLASLGLGATIMKLADDLQTPRLCSFDGRMRVLTRAGLHPIQSLDTQAEAWSRNDVTGKMGFNPITAHYWNDYPDQVHVVMRDVETGAEQTIISNRIHPYFVQTKRKVANSSEGHVYAGVLDDGHWVDAQHLVAGDRLLNSDESWSEVVSVTAVEKPIKAYNLTVANDHTYFIAGAANDNFTQNNLAKAVWVHNDCVSEIRWKSFNTKLEDSAKDHFEKHGDEFGAKNTQEYINMAKEFSKTEVGNGVTAHTVGNYKIKIDSNTGIVFVGNKSREIHTFYKSDGRVPLNELVDDVLNRARNKGY